MKEFSEIDRRHIWHPFTQGRVWDLEGAPIIEKGDGYYLYDVKGQRYLDGVSSLWCNVHGHNNKVLVDSLKQQSDKLCHSTLLGLSHSPIVSLTKELLEVVPNNLQRIFYADSGSTAVEAGLRMAIEFWQKQNNAFARKKTKLASLVGAYHGDTLGAVSVGFLEEFHSALSSIITPAERIRPPHMFRFCENLSENDALDSAISEARSLFENKADKLAAFIVEPLVQGAAGMWIHPVEYLREIAALCRRHNVLFIADEVATGFGKTGKMFAVDIADVEPDILILGKGISGGYLPISAAVTTEQIYEVFLGEPSEYKTFYYGQTFAGNPLAASVSSANLQLFKSTDLLETIAERIAFFKAEIDEHINPLSNVDEVRQFGFMVGIELTTKKGKHQAYPVELMVGHKIVQRARELGLIIRPLGNVMVLMPAVSMPVGELLSLVALTAQSIDDVCSTLSL